MATTYSVGQTVKLMHGDSWSTGYVESASCGVYGVRVAGERLYHVTAVSIRTLQLVDGRLEEAPIA